MAVFSASRGTLAPRDMHFFFVADVFSTPTVRRILAWFPMIALALSYSARLCTPCEPRLIRVPWSFRTQETPTG